MLQFNKFIHNMLDYHDYLSEFFMSIPVLIVQSALCLFSNLFDFLFKSLKELLSNFSWEIGEWVRRKHFCLRYGSHNRMLFVFIPC